MDAGRRDPGLPYARQGGQNKIVFTAAGFGVGHPLEMSAPGSLLKEVGSIRDQSKARLVSASYQIALGWVQSSQKLCSWLALRIDT